MKITIFISALSGGGAERVACNLANFLSKSGYEVEILTMGEAMPLEPLAVGIKEVTLLRDEERANPFLNFFKRIFRLRNYMKNHKVDVYVVFLTHLTRLMSTFSNLTKAAIIMSERADPTVYRKSTQKALKKAYRKLDGAVFQTDEVKAWYDLCIKKTKGVVIPNAINPVFIRPKYEGEKEKVIIGVGRLDKQKNFPLLISSFARVADKFPEHKLVIYGKGTLLEELQSLAIELGVGDRVEFPGYVSDMPERLEKASMFVLSSDYEGMPNALMEAMASGLPCVSTDCGGGGARFLIQNGDNGILIPQKDEVALASAMEKILSDETLAARLGENARKLQETLAPEKIYGEWEKYIQNVCKGR